jgi:uroporphyrinogen-III decarboxylase
MRPGERVRLALNHKEPDRIPIDLGGSIGSSIHKQAHTDLNKHQGLDTKRLKEEFGRYISFWGGVDTQHIMPLGTSVEVANEVRRRIDDLAPGSGFVFAAVHNIQAFVPPENIVTAFETALEYGLY